MPLLTLIQMQYLALKKKFYFWAFKNTKAKAFLENIFYPNYSIFIHIEFVLYAPYFKLIIFNLTFKS